MVLRPSPACGFASLYGGRAMPVQHRAPRSYFAAFRFRTLVGFAAAALALLVGVMYVVSASQTHGPLHGLRIAVDAGHGGEDRGVCHFDMDLIEKEINLDMANRLAAALEETGATVMMTRTDDTFLPLADRAALANNFGADLFISLHVNRIPGHPECFGAQTFYFPSSEEGKRLASLIQAELLAIDPDNHRQPMEGRFAVLRQSNMPGALVEIAFMTNPRDRSLLQTEAYREQVTQAILQGILRYVQGDTLP